MATPAQHRLYAYAHENQLCVFRPCGACRRMQRTIFMPESKILVSTHLPSLSSASSALYDVRRCRLCPRHSLCLLLCLSDAGAASSAHESACPNSCKERSPANSFDHNAYMNELADRSTVEELDSFIQSLCQPDHGDRPASHFSKAFVPPPRPPSIAIHSTSPHRAACTTAYTPFRR